ncbi:MAG TPA: porin family protein [Gemmatimonadaceae bacterium]|nr:porin family protein [Gemmatimonadaceae bacterium]
MKPASWIFALSISGAAARAPLALAQPPATKASWTIYAAVNYATVEGIQEVNKEPMTGKGFGVALDWRLNNVFTFQPELQYTEKGYQYDPYVPIKLKLTYIEVPLLLRASTEMADNGMRLYALAGPTLAMRRSCDASVGSASGKCNTLSQGMTTMDSGLLLGFGLDFRIRSSTLTTSLRYDRGLSDIQKTDGQAKSRAFSLLLGWRL